VIYKNIPPHVRITVNLSQNIIGSKIDTALVFVKNEVPVSPYRLSLFSVLTGAFLF